MLPSSELCIQRIALDASVVIPWFRKYSSRQWVLRSENTYYCETAPSQFAGEALWHRRVYDDAAATQGITDVSHSLPEYVAHYPGRQVPKRLSNRIRNSPDLLEWTNSHEHWREEKIARVVT